MVSLSCHASSTAGPWPFSILGLAIGLVGLLLSTAADAQTKPSEVSEFPAPEPKEISGVAAVPGGYAVVGDETGNHGRVWPSGGTWPIDPPLGGPESLDVEFGPDGKLHWFILDEGLRRIIDLEGGTFELPEDYKEVCGRGLEGLAVRRASATTWDVAALFEGGFYEPQCNEPGDFARPRVAILKWEIGKGTDVIAKAFDLYAPKPAIGLRFRAPDLVWDGDHLIVLLASLNKEGSPSGFSHTWLQRFDFDGDAVGAPIKLEDRWKSYRDKKNWEALDWTLDGRHLVMGYDSKSGSELVIFPWPYPTSD